MFKVFWIFFFVECTQDLYLEIVHRKKYTHGMIWGYVRSMSDVAYASIVMGTSIRASSISTDLGFLCVHAHFLTNNLNGPPNKVLGLN